ncbi:caspase domain-containing protein [Trametes elegans]|nr:caspase domain-containing protein [Trametes elegans]
MSRAPRSCMLSKRTARPPGLSPPRKTIQRALVIGINYTGRAVEEQLQGAHRDAHAWRQLLIDTYGYLDADVTLMLDATGWHPELIPTRKNILAQICRLVAGLKAGDRIVFFYAGHSQQLPTQSRSEEDGLDEALVPMDHDKVESGQTHNLIVDNDLRRHLVDPLPEGIFLTAIFDSCHSGTLLDLDHYLCNAVYFPWLNRGTRRSMSKWMNVRRRNARVEDKGNFRITSLSPEDAASGQGPLGKAGIRVYGRQPNSKGKATKFSSALEEIPESEKGERRFLFHRASSMQNQRKGSFFKRVLKRSHSHNNVFDDVTKDVASMFTLQRTESPEPLMKCTGQCEHVHSPNTHIISIAACHDPQQTYESKRGCSMTTDLVRLLKEDPHPACRRLVQQLGHYMHKTAMLVHAASRKQLARKKLGKDVRVLDGVNFSEPQIGSQHTLTEDYPITM